jgi:hypothetical protein
MIWSFVSGRHGELGRLFVLQAFTPHTERVGRQAEWDCAQAASKRPFQRQGLSTHPYPISEAASLPSSVSRLILVLHYLPEATLTACECRIVSLELDEPPMLLHASDR